MLEMSFLLKIMQISRWTGEFNKSYGCKLQLIYLKQKPKLLQTVKWEFKMPLNLSERTQNCGSKICSKLSLKLPKLMKWRNICVAVLKIMKKSWLSCVRKSIRMLIVQTSFVLKNVRWKIRKFPLIQVNAVIFAMALYLIVHSICSLVYMLFTETVLYRSLKIRVSMNLRMPRCDY